MREMPSALVVPLLLCSLPLAFAAVTAPTKVVMKFGGSSVRDAARISEVCKLVKDQIDGGVQPHLVCSAMGKTTNNLLSAADRALTKQEVDLSTVRALHTETAEDLGLEASPEFAAVLSLLDECERTLEGISLLGELSPRTRDRVVAYGERMSGRMVSANLKNIGVPSVQIESWDLGVQTKCVVYIYVDTDICTRMAINEHIYTHTHTHTNTHTYVCVCAYAYRGEGPRGADQVRRGADVCVNPRPSGAPRLDPAPLWSSEAGPHQSGSSFALPTAARSNPLLAAPSSGTRR